MGDVMELDIILFVIGCICGACLVLTAWNTYKLHIQPKIEKPQMTEAQKREEEEFEALMKYRGRASR